MAKVIKISRRSLVRLVEQELALEGIEWANVGGDGRRWLGGMNLAKYPGPWASGHEPLIGDEDPPGSDPERKQRKKNGKRPCIEDGLKKTRGRK